MSPLRDVVVAGLAGSSKYRDLAPETLARTADWALERHPRPADALKAAKRKLHQAFGAYLDPGALAAVGRILDGLGPDPDREALETTATRILALHRSAAERLPIVREFYETIFEAAGRPASILDVAAGLNAFALPFMGLPGETRYTSVEVDRGLAAATERFLQLTGRPGEAIWADALIRIPETDAELALVLKTLPCLEQQEDGAALALLQRLAAIQQIAVSYPVRSLGGREKGMTATYRAQIADLAAQIGRPQREIMVEHELVVLLGPAEM